MLYEAARMADSGELPENVLQHPELQRYAAGWGRPDDLGFIAFTDAQPVGAAWLRRMADASPASPASHWPELAVGVLPSHRGRGIGTRLVERLIAASSTRFPAITLNVRLDNPAIHLYERLGFHTIAGSEFTNWAGTVSIFMVLCFGGGR